MRDAARKNAQRGSLSRGHFADGNFPYNRHMADYALRIMKYYGLLEEIIGLVLASIPVRDRRGLVDRIYFGDGKPGKGEMPDGSYTRVARNLRHPGNIDDEILGDVFQGNTVMDEAAVIGALKERLRGAVARWDGKAARGLERRADELKGALGLDDRDISLLVFLCCVYSTNLGYLKEMQDDLTYSGFLNFISVATGLPAGTVKERLGSDGRLFRTGIIEGIDTVRPDFYSLNDNVADFLAGSSDRSLIEKSIRIDTERVYELASFGVDTESAEIVRGLLSADRPVNLIFHGDAGTGKTEFARAVAASTGKRVYLLNHRPETGRKGGGEYDPLLVLNVAGRAVPADKGIIIVDEADYILNTGDRFSLVSDTVEKGMLNAFLDRSRSQMIWISNRVSNMEESSLRRFSYSLHFRAYTGREREKIWHAILAGSPLRPWVSPDLVRVLSLEFRVNAGGIASAVEAAALMFRGRRKSPAAVSACLRRLLERHEEMIRRDNGRRKALGGLTERYDLSSLNTDTEPGRVISTVTAFADRWTGSVEERDENLNILFWGPPGTGKTEFVKYLAKHAGMRLLVRRYADLESMWVGQAEKNIAAAFDEAEETRAILFIDEADSFFTRRDGARHSWEVSRTNEFLTRMENHRGIFICCTNLLPSMDEAALRRFHVKVHFDTLSEDGKERLYRAYFLRKGERLAGAMRRRIISIEGLTPGDFAAVSRGILHACEGENNHERIIADLATEAGYRVKKRTVGF